MPRMIHPAGTMPQHSRQRSIRPIPRRVRRPKQSDYRPLQRRRQMQWPSIARDHQCRPPHQRDHLPNRAGNQRRRSAARLHDPSAHLILRRRRRSPACETPPVPTPPPLRRTAPPATASLPTPLSAQSTQTALPAPASNASHHCSAAGSTGNVTFAGRSVSPTAAPSNSHPCSTTCVAVSLIFCL